MQTLPVALAGLAAIAIYKRLVNTVAEPYFVIALSSGLVLSFGLVAVGVGDLF